MRTRPRACGRRDRESGASAIEFVLWTPLLFLFVFGSVQFGLAMFARHVAITAAQEGARTARERAQVDTRWRDHARQDAKTWVTQLIGGLVADPSWEPTVLPPTTRTYPEVGVSVSFSIVTEVPGWRIQVGAVSKGLIECYYSRAGTCVTNG